MKNLILFPLFLVFVFSGCTSTPKKQPGAITVMAYNVENLFDNLDDPGKEDETYLPLAEKSSPAHRTKCQGTSNDYYRKQCMEVDWNDKIIETKMKRIADVVMQEGNAPDVLILEEVENLNILERLRANHLSKAGYKEAILIEGPDNRGIDVAMLSKLPLASQPKLHEIDLKGTTKDKNREPRPTRGILQAQFQLPDQKVLTVFGVHFPSQGNPTAARRAAIKKLNELKKALPADALAIAGGDFNITMEEDAKEGLYHKELSQEWLISHQIGCKNCEGTHNYRGSWSFLDALLFSKNMNGGSGWKVLPQTIRVANKSIYQLNHWGSPARFSEKTQVGVSDHWPLVVEIVPGKEVRL